MLPSDCRVVHVDLICRRGREGQSGGTSSNSLTARDQAQNTTHADSASQPLSPLSASTGESRAQQERDDNVPEAHRSDLEATGEARKKVIQRLLEQQAGGSGSATPTTPTSPGGGLVDSSSPRSQLLSSPSAEGSDSLED